MNKLIMTRIIELTLDGGLQKGIDAYQVGQLQEASPTKVVSLSDAGVAISSLQSSYMLGKSI